MFNDKAIASFRGPWGVPIEIGSSLPLLIIIILVANGSPSPFILSFIAVIIVSILLHELGHTWGCIVQGVPVSRVMIYGGGGFCQPARKPSHREDELIIAMGPIVNIALWAFASLALNAFDGGLMAVVLWQIKVVNLVLFAFNMLPVQPLDGGRLLHLLLLRFLEPLSALRVTGFIGLIVSILWIPAMLMVWFSLGFFILFMPQIGLHWAMFQAKRR